MAESRANRIHDFGRRLAGILLLIGAGVVLFLGPIFAIFMKENDAWWLRREFWIVIACIGGLFLYLYLTRGI